MLIAFRTIYLSYAVLPAEICRQVPSLAAFHQNKYSVMDPALLVQEISHRHKLHGDASVCGFALPDLY